MQGSLRVHSGRRITHMQWINSWRATPVSGAFGLALRQCCHTCGTAAFSLTRRPSCAAAPRPEVNSNPPTSGLTAVAGKGTGAAGIWQCGVALCWHAAAAVAPLLAQSVCVLNFRLGQCCHGASPVRVMCCPNILLGSLGLISLCIFLPSFFFWQRHHIGMRR